MMESLCALKALQFYNNRKSAKHQKLFLEALTMLKQKYFL